LQKEFFYSVIAIQKFALQPWYCTWDVALNSGRVVQFAALGVCMVSEVETIDNIFVTFSHISLKGGGMDGRSD